MVMEYRVNWTGTTITGPGISVFHGRPSPLAPGGAAEQDLANRCRAYFAAIANLVPNGIVWDFPAEVAELDTVTGQLVNVTPITKPVDVSSNGGVGVYARPAGARTDWLTGAIVSGRRLRGRTFLVPINSAQFDTAGTLVAGAISTMNAAATTYIGTSASFSPSVWSRTHGIQADIIAFNVPDTVAVLRSRRD